MKYALIAGGSKGIGYAIAAALAKRKYNLILIARDEVTLIVARNSLQSLYGVTVIILVKDLSLIHSADEIASWCIEKKISLKMLCNVAGLGGKDDYLTLQERELRYMINLNVSSQMAMCRQLLPLLEKNSPSYILNVASMAGFAPIPEKNLYAATKAAVIFFSYSLHYQLKRKKISVSCLCPGPVFTKPEIEQDTIEKLGWFGKQMAVAPEQVGEVAVRNTLNRRMIITPGLLSGTIAIFLRLMPRRILVFIYDKLGKK